MTIVRKGHLPDSMTSSHLHDICLSSIYLVNEGANNFQFSEQLVLSEWIIGLRKVDTILVDNNVCGRRFLGFWWNSGRADLRSCLGG
jgi:hypothetical protein